MSLPDQPPFAHFLGIKLISVTADRLEAELTVREEFKNGRSYYSLSRTRIALPRTDGLRPNQDLLAWHQQEVYRG